MDRTKYIADMVTKEYKNINQQAIEEYKQKFLADIEKLKKERKSKNNDK